MDSSSSINLQQYARSLIVNYGEEQAVQSFLGKLFDDVNTEIQFLKEMLDYNSEKNVYSFGSSSAFNDFIKNCIGLNISTSLLDLMIKNLKDKYETREIKFPVMDSMVANDALALQLGRKIWGSATETGTKSAADERVTKTNKKRKEGLKIGQQQNYTKHPYLKGSFKSIRGSFKITVKEAIGFLGESTMKDLDEKWKKIRIEEIELSLKKTDLIREQTKAALDAIKSQSVDKVQDLAKYPCLEESLKIMRASLRSDVKQGLGLVEEPKMEELEGKWKKLQVEEIELYLKKKDLIKDQIMGVLDVIKSQSLDR